MVDSSFFADFKANKGQVEAIKMKDFSHKARIIHWGNIKPDLGNYFDFHLEKFQPRA